MSAFNYAVEQALNYIPSQELSDNHSTRSSIAWYLSTLTEKSNEHDVSLLMTISIREGDLSTCKNIIVEYFALPVSKNQAYSLTDLAIIFKQYELAKYFLQLDIPISDKRIVFEFIEDDNQEMIEFIAINFPELLRVRNAQRYTPLMFSVVKEKLEMVKILCRAGCEINVQTHKGETALLLAVGRKTREGIPIPNFCIIEALLENGADSMISDNRCVLPLNIADSYNLPSVLFLLLTLDTRNFFIPLTNARPVLHPSNTKIGALPPHFPTFYEAYFHTLQISIERGELVKFIRLLNLNPRLIHSRFDPIYDGYFNVLLHAVEYRRVSFVDFLLASFGPAAAEKGEPSFDTVDVIHALRHAVRIRSNEITIRILKARFPIENELREGGYLERKLLNTLGMERSMAFLKTIRAQWVPKKPVLERNERVYRFFQRACTLPRARDGKEDLVSYQFM